MTHPKHLFLLRHGEAMPGIGPVGDLKRQLSEVGINKINQLSKYLQNRNIEIDLLLFSPSVRTSQTAEIISKNLILRNSKVENEIYEADTRTLVNLINKTDSNVQNLFLVGHNPSLSSLVSYLTGNDSINLFPGTLAIVDFTLEDWSQIGQNTGFLFQVIE